MNYIGIDPDIQASGVACYDEQGLKLYNLRFFELYEFLKQRTNYTVVVECGEQNKSLWNSKGRSRVALNIAMKTGKNFAVSDLIIEMCKVLNVAKVHHYVPGTQKMTHEYLSRIVSMPKKSNQEQRDALRCILGLF